MHHSSGAILGGRAAPGSGWSQRNYLRLPKFITAVCGGAAFRPRCPTRSGLRLENGSPENDDDTAVPTAAQPPSHRQVGRGRGDLGTPVKSMMDIDATSTPAASTPQADAETGGEEDAERHDADHPQVFGFHRSMSPFRKRDVIPSRQVSLTTSIFSFSARSSCTALVVDSSHLKHSAHIMTMPMIHQAICQDHSGGNPAKEKA